MTTEKRARARKGTGIDPGELLAVKTTAAVALLRSRDTLMQHGHSGRATARQPVVELFRGVMAAERGDSQLTRFNLDDHDQGSTSETTNYSIEHLDLPDKGTDATVCHRGGEPGPQRTAYGVGGADNAVKEHERVDNASPRCPACG